MADEALIGRLTQIRYKSPDTGWTVGVVQTKKNERRTVVGVLHDVELGTLLEMHGYWKEHERFGEQFNVVSYGPPSVDSAEGLLGFLEYLPHIGTGRAAHLINHFGEDKVIEVLDKAPHRLTEIPGITKARVPEIMEGYAKLKAAREDLIFLRGLGLKPGQCNRVREFCHKEKIGVKALFETNPYRLTEIRGFGFPTVDSMALSFGIKAEDMCRCKAAVLHVLEDARGDGDCYVPKDELISETTKLAISHQRSEEALQILLGENEVIADADNMYSKHMHRAEMGVAYHVNRLAREEDKIINESIEKVKAEDIGLHELQLEAIKTAMKHRFTVLTGGPGCLAGDTEIIHRRHVPGADTGKPTTLKTLYRKFNGLKGNGPAWSSTGTSIRSVKENGVVFYNDVIAVVESGVKECIRVVTKGGRSLVCTPDHPIMVEGGAFREAQELTGEMIVCTGSMRAQKGADLSTRPKRCSVTIKYHPYGAVRIREGKYHYKEITRARAVVEAHINNISLEAFKHILREDEEQSKQLKYLNPELEIHHKDEDSTNDVIENLEVLTKEEHARLHGKIENLNIEYTILDEVVRIDPAPEQMTYDIQMKAPHHNFEAGGMFVHNTGKTTTLKEVIQLMKEAGVTLIRGCAPTGKAAMRMKEQAHIAARTIHRLLEWDPVKKHFTHNEYEKLEVGLLIVDESSMVDVELMQCLLCAIPDSASVMIVGDVDQLPSVGPGSVLRDIIRSGMVPVTRLTHIFRQSENSWIAQNAANINNGIMPVLSDDSEDFFFVECDEPTEIPEIIAELVLDWIPKNHNIEPKDTQVLCPQKGTPVGTNAINSFLQSIWPKEKGETWSFMSQFGKYEIGAGDQVIHTVNNYTLGVMNGETGTVQGFIEVEQETRESLFDESENPAPKGEPGELKVEITSGPTLKEIKSALEKRPKPKGKKTKKLAVDFGDRVVYYSKLEAQDLLLAYAITIHKSQGSEYPAVVIPVHSVNTFMLSRSLLYTAITRGKQAVYLVGQLDALERGVMNDKSAERYTALTRRLKESTCSATLPSGSQEPAPTPPEPSPT